MEHQSNSGQGKDLERKDGSWPCDKPQSHEGQRVKILETLFEGSVEEAGWCPADSVLWPEKRYLSGLQ